MPFASTWRFLALLVLLLAAAVPTGAPAQGVGQVGSGIVAEQRKVLDGLTAQVDALERDMTRNAEDDPKLVEIRLKLESVHHEVIQSSVAFRPRLAEINGRLQQLGPPPASGEPPEPDIVTAERQGLVSEKAEINAVLGLAEQLSIRIANLTDKIATMRSDLFRNLLTKRYPLTDTFDSAFNVDVKAEFASFYRTVSSWLRFVYRFKFQSALAATLLATIAAVVLLIGGRRFFQRHFDADPTIESPSYLSRLSVAFWSTLLPTAAVAMFLGLTLFFFNYYNVLRSDIAVFLDTLFAVSGLVFCVNRLARAALGPSRPNWRLIPVESGSGRWPVGLTTAMAVVIGINGFLSVVNEEMGSPLSLTIARSFVATIIVGLLLIVMALLKPFRDKEGVRRPWPAWLRYMAFAIGGFTIAAALLGYIGLAHFISLQVVVTGTVLLTAYIGFLSSREIGAEGGFAETSAGRWLASNSNTEASTLDQLGLVVSTAINLMIVAIFLPLVLFLWGFQPGDIQAWAQRLAGGFSIGSFSFSPVGILTGIVVFAIGYFFTRWFQSWLDGSVMARGRVDAGVRNSIRTVVGYAGLALAGVIAVSAAGINLSNLALIAGGLSLGIGFGLQNVVSNFVSGLILLAERPFKVGDWIVAGAVSGTVKKISVRATEIETFQRQTVIMPNSELINSAVGNWTLRNKLGRVDIKVNVAYGSDVRRAHRIMSEIAAGHPMVLRNPEPFVLFVNFGPAALEFEIRVFLADVMNGNVVQNDLRFAVMDAFQEAGIDIPSTPRAMDLKPADKWPADDDKAEAELIEIAEQRRVQEAAMASIGKSRRRKPDPD